MALIRPIPSSSIDDLQEFIYASRVSGAGTHVTYANSEVVDQYTAVDVNALNNEMKNFTVGTSSYGYSLTATKACDVIINLNGTSTTRSLAIGDTIDFYSNNEFFVRSIAVI